MRVNVLFAVLFALGAIVLVSNGAFAHCDTLDGPVVQAARIALDKGDITPLLKWVRDDDEKEIRVAFQKTLAVRTKGAEAQELADMYFFETLGVNSAYSGNFGRLFRSTSATTRSKATQSLL